MKYNSSNHNIVFLEWNNKEHIAAVCKLHMKLLPESILSKMGYLFLSKFYYAKFIRDSSIEVYLYKHEEKFVGFISCTNRPFTFIDEGNKKHLLTICFLLGVSIILKPIRLGTILKMKNNVSFNHLQGEYNDEIGQFLSLGVLEDARKMIDPIEKVTISNVLMKLVFHHFNANGKMWFFLEVLKSNKRAIQFYEKHGGIIIPNTIEQVESIVVKFKLQLKQV